MRKMARKSVLLIILTAFAVGWVLLMSLGTAGSGTVQRGSASGPDGTTASIPLLDADSAFPTINIHVLIRDQAGQPVRGLDPAAFELTEDGIPVDTEFTGAGQQIVTSILVMDHSGSMENGGKMRGAREATKAYVSMARAGQDRLGVLIFNDDIDTLAALKRIERDDIDGLTRQIDRVAADGGTAFHDAVYAAVNDIHSAAGRKVVIALTDGLDKDSRRSVDQVIEYAQDNHIPVYTIGLGSGGDIDTDRLRRLARETDGEFHQTPTADELAALYRRIAQGLQNEYVLSYTSPTPKLDGTRREVVVNVAYDGGALSVGDSYTVGGIIETSFNWPLFGSLLLLLLGLIALPDAARRLRSLRPTPDEAKPPPPQPQPDDSAQEPPPPPPRPRPATAHLIAHFTISGDSVSIGSDEGNDIVVPSPSVALQHARIGVENGRYVITDLSQGHTAVSFGGDPAQLRPAQRNALKDGSLVKLGGVVLTFRQSAQGSAWLEMAHEVTKEIVTIGSEDSNNITLAHPSVSPRHAALRWDAGRLVVHDLDSAHGTFVSYSGEPAQERQVQANALKNGSTVRFGQLVFTIALRE